jgi:type IV pilus assembly protein PilN
MLEVNLLPVREVRKRAEARQTVLQLALVLALTVCAIAALHTRLVTDMGRVEGRIQQMEKDIARFKPQLEQVEAFKKKKSELEKKIDVIDGLDRQRRGPVRLLAELADHIPQRAWLTSLETSGGTIKLEGESLDNELVALFLRDLGSSSYFQEVDLEATKLNAAKGGLKLVSFEVRASLAGTKRPEAPAKVGKPQPGKGKGRAAAPGKAKAKAKAGGGHSPADQG